MVLLEGPYFINLANSVSRSFPTAFLVQSSMHGTAPAWHQVNPLVIAGEGFL
jgi:hypothetical protein